MNWYEQYKVTVPEGEDNGMNISRFSVDNQDPGAFVANLRLAFDGRRPVPDGTYTRLATRSTLWMSDTPAEIADHLAMMHSFDSLSDGRVLINGLGIGVVVQAAIRSKGVAHIDVVEKDERVFRLVAPHYYVMAQEAGKSLMIHLADAYTITWPVGTRWNTAWHDIWPDINADNLDGMKKLHRKYGRSVDCQSSWCRNLVERMQ